MPNDHTETTPRPTATTQTTGKLAINQWAVDDRPRERFAAQGADSLTAAELLAILIGSGSQEESAVELMQRILADHRNSLSELGKCGIAELCTYKGMGPAKAITVLAACELGRRRAAEQPEKRTQIRSSRDIYEFFHSSLCDLAHEECHVLLLNNSLKVLGRKCISRGGIAGTVVDVRLVLEAALLVKAAAIAVCHNHPSGHKRPSNEDDQLTAQLKRGAEAVGIRLVDHIVLVDGDYFSYSDEGRL